ncbi:hypothetical protein BDV96DRAFT_676698 [Lophiotrema nucula]|uniref:2EXR domain-containing protein n=1 Tax=Lophiotrema nucula TaxID=690887 RepID=A0A6A5ZLS1_9PLEO|nr:hypothetical protein BDV96DRAFT_676698 [Lophiotrema nucula]
MQSQQLKRRDQTSATLRTDLLELPAEIRNQIWEHAASDDVVRIVHIDTHTPPGVEPGAYGINGLLQACKQTRKECMPLRTKHHIIRPNDLKLYLETFYPSENKSEAEIAAYAGELIIDIGAVDRNENDVKLDMFLLARFNSEAAGFKLRFLSSADDDMFNGPEANDLNTIFEGLLHPPTPHLRSPVIASNPPPNANSLDLYNSMKLVVPPPVTTPPEQRPHIAGIRVPLFLFRYRRRVQLHLTVDRVRWKQYAEHRYGKESNMGLLLGPMAFVLQREIDGEMRERYAAFVWTLKLHYV